MSKEKYKGEGEKEIIVPVLNQMELADNTFEAEGKIKAAFFHSI